MKSICQTKKNVLEKTASALSSVSSWEADKIGEVMVNTAKELEVKNSEYFMTMRVAITGKKISPPLNESMEILGKEKVIERINGI
jgi:glutamyl-tRNA synthetase